MSHSIYRAGDAFKRSHYVVIGVTMAGQPDATRSKVGRVIAEYDLEGLGAELERRWSAEGDERASLRELATYFNQRVLEAALDAHDQQPITETVESTYRLLTDDDASPASQTRVTRELERAGIDIDALRDDFVSHQAIHTYLTDYRDASPPSSDSSPVETAESALNRLQSRMDAVASSQIERLAKSGDVAESDVEVFVNVEVFCNECGRSTSVVDYIQSGGCECSKES